MAAEHCIKTIEHPDGKSRLLIFERDDGLYRFESEVLAVQEGYTFWSSRDISGLHGSAKEAEHEARQTVPWLRS